jgi:hypothetical protein
MTLHIDSLLLASARRARSNATAAFAPIHREDRPSHTELLAIFAAKRAR